MLARLVAENPALKSRIVCVQLLAPGESLGRKEPVCDALEQRDFLLEMDEPSGPLGRLGRQGLDRLVRHLRGVKIGLALGGGGARGLAHLGVLKMLDRAGISFDMMRGTSAGAMIGLGYAAGMDPNELVEVFARELQPPTLLHRFRGGRRLTWFVEFARVRGKKCSASTTTAGLSSNYRPPSLSLRRTWCNHLGQSKFDGYDRLRRSEQIAKRRRRTTVRQNARRRRIAVGPQHTD